MKSTGRGQLEQYGQPQQPALAGIQNAAVIKADLGYAAPNTPNGRSASQVSHVHWYRKVRLGMFLKHLHFFGSRMQTDPCLHFSRYRQLQMEIILLTEERTGQLRRRRRILIAGSR